MLKNSKSKGFTRTNFAEQNLRGPALSSSNGFTLIELLVVIAIIGILSSIVLASLNTARNKAANAAVKADLSQLRVQSEVYRDGSAGNTYTGFCASSQAVLIRAHIDTVDDTASPTYCAETAVTGAEYAAAAKLRIAEGTNTHWCVDSRGISRGGTSMPLSTTCP